MSAQELCTIDGDVMQAWHCSRIARHTNAGSSCENKVVVINTGASRGWGPVWLLVLALAPLGRCLFLRIYRDAEHI